jgi:N-acetylneuraminic acid mutarotase
LSLSANQVTEGQQITVTTTVSNQGNGTSKTTNIKFYFSTNSTGKDNYLGEISLLSLSAGTSTPLNATVTVPSTTTLQGYIVAVVNPDYLASESTTGNNIASSRISIIDNEPPTIKSLSLGWGFYKTGYKYPIIFEVVDNKGVNSLDFYYSIDNGTNWNIITNYFIPGSNDCQWCYYWTIPTTIIPPTSLLITMIARDTSGNIAQAFAGPYDIKDGTKPSVTILSPNGGEIWDLGSTQTIKWNVNAPNGIGRMDLYLYWEDRAEYIANVTSNTTGTYNWTLPTSSSFVTSTARIKIRVIDMNWNENEDWSDNYFTIHDTSTPPPEPWTMPQVITSVPSTNWPYTSKDHSNPVLATDNFGNVHMVYKYVQDDSSGIVNNTGPRVIKQEILYKKLTGSTWSSPIVVYNITQNTDGNLSGYYGLGDLQISVDSFGNPHIVWTTNFSGPITNWNQNNIFYTYYNGTAWDTPINLSDSIPGFPTLTNLTWTTKANLPEAKSYAASAVINNKIYAIGDPFDNTVKIYDPSNNTWATGAQIPTPRRLMGVATVNGKLYAIGGGDGSLNPFNTIEEYNPSTNTWTTKTSMPTPRYGPAVAVVNNLIYVFGGAGSGGLPVNTVDVYNPATNTWSTKTSMPTRRSLALAAAVNNKIYVIGGRSSSGYSNAVEEYDPTSDSWLTKTSMPTARMGAAGGAIGSNIYVVGGYDGTSDVAVNEQVTITTGGSRTVSIMPRITIDSSDNVYVIWLDGYSWNSDFTTTGESNIYYRKKDNGGTWSSVAHALIDLARDGNNNLHMVWYYYDYLTETQQILYSYYDGTSWATPEKISDISGEICSQNCYLNYPTIVVDSLGRPHVTFEETNQSKLIYKYKDINGWSTPVQLNLSSQYVEQGSSDIAISLDDHIHVVWVSSYGGHSEIFYNHADVSGSINDITSPSVSVTTPSTGDQLSIGSTYNISWSATDNIG